MALISFSEVGKFYGRQDVLKAVSFFIKAGERVGLVGRNGAGKTTLINLIMQRENPDEGGITRARGLRLGHLPQELISRSGLSLLALVMDTAEEYRRVEAELAVVNAEMAEKAGAASAEELMELAARQGQLMQLFESLGGWQKEAEAKKILSGLGFRESDFERDMGEFSGGWMMRAVLARLLLASPDLLVLDEPTNHLDIDSLIWLEGYLKASSSALLLVSHDRAFLNNVVTRVIELRQGRAHCYQGNYDSFLNEKAQRLATEAAAFENQQQRIKQIEKFIERNRVRASTARRAQSRLKMLDRLERVEEPETDERNFSFRLPKPERGPDLVAQIQSGRKSYGAVEVYLDLNLTLRRGERLALIGPNGRGKSTLLKIIAGLEPLSSGTRRLGQGVRLGYFAQFQLDTLRPDYDLVEELSTVAGELGPGSLRSILGQFLFSGDDVFKKVAVLSGGEKARLALAKIMLTAPNLLLLDEPTNHLDIPGRQMLEDALADYSGTIVLISHDRHFINALCSSVATVDEGRLNIYPGDYDYYSEVWRKDEAGGQKNPNPLTPEGGGQMEPSSPSPQSLSRKELRQMEAEARRQASARRRPLERRLKELEARLEAIGAEKEALGLEMSDPVTYQDGERARLLARNFQALELETAELEKNWEETMEELESLG